MKLTMYLNHTKSDSGRVQSLWSELSSYDYSLATSFEDCDYVLAFFSKEYLNDHAAVQGLTYAACNLRRDFFIVMLEELQELPAELEMLAARHGFISPESFTENISTSISEQKQASKGTVHLLDIRTPLYYS